jgi:hypothetical protein
MFVAPLFRNIAVMTGFIYFYQSVINLAEQHGKEAAITTAYRDHVSELADPDVS